MNEFVWSSYSFERKSNPYKARKNVKYSLRMSSKAKARSKERSSRTEGAAQLKQLNLIHYIQTKQEIPGRELGRPALLAPVSDG